MVLNLGPNRLYSNKSGALAALKHLLAEKLPGMPFSENEASSAGLIYPHTIGVAAPALYQSISDSTPEAGHFYWSAQCWNMLCWQPVILTLISVHCTGLSPKLSVIGQYQEADVVRGLTLNEASFSHPESQQLAFLSAAQQLKTYLNSALNQLTEHFALNRKLMRYLFADRVLSTLLLLQQATSSTENPALKALASQWLEELELQEMSSLMGIHFEGSERLALDRKGCCQHFRREGAVVCASCPRHKKPERIRLILESWKAA